MLSKSHTHTISKYRTVVIASSSAFAAEPKQEILKPGQPAVASLEELVSDLNEEQRLNHARELLGRFYDRSVVRTGEQLEDIKRFVHNAVRKELPPAYRKRYASKLADTILSESQKHGFDPIFLLAVIKNESSFKPKVRGTSGEIGLMQLMPNTAREVARREKIKWRGLVKTLEDPQTNVRLGAAYLAHLREQMDSHGRLYLSAYNMGARNVRKALDRSIWPKEYVQRVMHRYVDYYRSIRDSLAAKAQKKLGSSDDKKDCGKAGEAAKADPKNCHV
jgi:soluble lytic murein transglycosylase